MGHDPHEAVAAVTLGRWSWMTGPHAHHRRPGARWLTMLMLVGSLVIGPVADAQETSGPTEQAATSEPASLDIRPAAAESESDNVRTSTINIELTAPTSDQQPAAQATEIPFDQLAETDSDGDAIPDSFDNCPWNSNAGQEDNDGNGVGNACEGLSAQDPTPEPDYDADGIPDASDNCWKMANPGQQDGDGDGLGNGCDEGSAPYIIGDPNDFAAERAIEDAVVIAAGEDISAEAAEPPPPLVEPTVAPDAGISGSTGDGGGDRGERDREDRQNRGDTGEAAPSGDSGQSDASSGAGETPVERGDRPRRNPDLTEPSGPVDPPPDNTRRMGQERTALESVVRIDSGLEKVGDPTATPVVDTTPVTYSDMPTATPLSDPGDGPPPTALAERTSDPVAVGEAPVPVEEGTVLDMGTRKRRERATPTPNPVASPAGAATSRGAQDASTAEAGGQVIETADPGDGIPTVEPTTVPTSPTPEATPAGKGGSKKRDRAPAPADENTIPWQADADFRGGVALVTTEPIAGTEDDAIFQTQRVGDDLERGESFVYAIPVPEDGIFRVRLYFAEVEIGIGESPRKSKGKRVFNVDAEGERALQDLDIAAEVGPATALVKMFDVEVDDGTLELEFIAEKGQPSVAAIEVLLPQPVKDEAPKRGRDRNAAMPSDRRAITRSGRLRRQ